MLAVLKEKACELTETRNKFEKEIFEHYNSVPNRFEWKTREWIQKKIDENVTSEKYVIEEKDGNKVVIIAKGVIGRGMQIVPIEDYFGVIYAAHIFTGHGIRKTLREYFANEKVYMPTKAIKCFLNLCEPCNAIKLNNVNKIITYHGFVELINMSKTPDRDSKFIMHFRALKLNRYYLRPLHSSDAMEVAEQMLKLFAQIGSPRMLHTPTMSFTKALILRIAIICPKYKIICGREMEFEGKSLQIKANLKKWMINNKSSEWTKRIYKLTSFAVMRNQKPRNETENNIDEAHQEDGGNLSGPSLKKLEHELYCQNNKSTDEVFKLLTPSPTWHNKWGKSTPTTYSKQVQKRDYSRKNKNKPEVTIPAVEKKEESPGDKVLCIDPHVKAFKVNKGTHKLETIHAIWNSMLDLPRNSESTKATVIGMDMIEVDRFGIIPQGETELPDYSDHKEVGKLSFSEENKKQGTGPTANVPAPKYRSNDYEQQEDNKAEIKPFDIKVDFTEEENCLGNILNLNTLENNPVKEEPIDLDISSNDVNMVDVKQEDTFLATIIKVETLNE